MIIEKYFIIIRANVCVSVGGKNTCLNILSFKFRRSSKIYKIILKSKISILKITKYENNLKYI